ncbi:MAG: PQQ-binding-like beta-propeller repeat protein, partial [Vicinamibacterales bacterium]
MIASVALAGVTIWGQGPNPRRQDKDATELQTRLMPAEPAWTVTLDAAPSAGGANDGASIYVPLRSEKVVALSRVDGRVVWTRDVESMTRPVAGGGLVFVLASDELFALDSATGSDRWRVPFDHDASARISVFGDRVVGFTDRSTLASIISTEGRVAWRRELTAPSPHAVVGDASRLYAALDDGAVVAVSASNGDVVWQRKLPGALAQPALVSNRVIVGSDTNEVFALESDTGAIAWRWRVGGDVVGAAGSPETVFIVALDNVLRAVGQSNGNQRWKKPLASRPASPPELFGDLVVITSAAPTITAFNRVTGESAGTYVAPAEVEGPALLVPATGPLDVVMVVITRDGRVVGLRPKPPAPPPAPSVPS